MRVKVLTVIGTRPEAIKLFPLVHALEADPRFNSRVCVTGQHREMVDEVLRCVGIDRHHDLAVMRDGQSLDALTARLLTGVGKVLDREKPDWVIVQGDTTTTLAGALASLYRKIPVCHVEAGLRSGTIERPWPEEFNRRTVSSIASLHCAPTKADADALLREGHHAEAVHITGNTVVDALLAMRALLTARPELGGEVRQIEDRAQGRKIITVTCHRRENWGARMSSIARGLQQLALRDDVLIVCPLHPNFAAKTAFAQLAISANVVTTPSLDYPNFCRLLAASHIVLTDSGGIQEEASILGIPVLVMRSETERIAGVRFGNARLVDADAERIVATTEALLDDGTSHRAMARRSDHYGDGYTAPRIVELIANWRKPACLSLEIDAEPPRRFK